MTTADLREKDVINICSGKKLGYIVDFQLDPVCGKIIAVYVSDRLFGGCGNKHTRLIPWDNICCLGDDAVLVRVTCTDGEEPEPCCEAKKQGKGGRTWFFG